MEFTMLNGMADRDIHRSIERQKTFGVRHLDLKDCVFGKKIEDITDPEVQELANLATDHEMGVYCLSTSIFGGSSDQGEVAFRQEYAGSIERTLELAAILRPQFVRFLSPQSKRRSSGVASWLIRQFQEAIDVFAESGFRTTIENECGNTVFCSPQAIMEFFERLDRPNDVSLTWDLQNLWQMGTIPSMDVYRQLRPITAYIHVKGGRVVDGEMYKSTLDEADYPLTEILTAARQDGVSPIVCLNPPHGRMPDGLEWDELFERDVEFLTHF